MVMARSPAVMPSMPCTRLRIARTIERASSQAKPSASARMSAVKLAQRREVDLGVGFAVEMGPELVDRAEIILCGRRERGMRLGEGRLDRAVGIALDRRFEVSGQTVDRCRILAGADQKIGLLLT